MLQMNIVITKAIINKDLTYYSDGRIDSNIYAGTGLNVFNLTWGKKFHKILIQC